MGKLTELLAPLKSNVYLYFIIVIIILVGGFFLVDELINSEMGLQLIEDYFGDGKVLKK